MGGSVLTDNSKKHQKRKQTSEIDESNASEFPENIDSPPASPALSILSLDSANSDSRPSTSTSTSVSRPRAKQLKLDMTFAKQRSFEEGGSRAADITNKILFFIAKDDLPYATVENEGFQMLMKTVAPLYHIPSRKTVTNLMEEKYEALSSLIKEQLSNVTHISLTTDIWTDQYNTKSYLGVTGHFISGEDHKSVTIGVTELADRHTADYIMMWLLEIIKNWKIDKEKIVVVVSDNAANIKKAITDAFGAEKHLPCFAHTLNLVPSNIIQQDENIKPICKKVKSIVTYFKKSVTAADRLRALSSLKLIQSVETRWNSTYYMFSRFIALAEQIGSILLQSIDGPQMLSASELQTVKEFVQLLEPFEQATKIISGEAYTTGSKIIPLITSLKKRFDHIIPNTETGRHLKKMLTDGFSKRFEKIEQISLLGMATILDPRFKSIDFRDIVACSHSINKIAKALYDSHNLEMQGDSTDNPPSACTDVENFWSYHEELVHISKSKQTSVREENQMPDDLRYYLHQSPIPMNENPVKYWQLNGSSRLQALALRYLTIIATSVPSERLFSRAGNIITENRSRLTADHFQHLLFLNSLSAADWHFN